MTRMFRLYDASVTAVPAARSCGFSAVYGQEQRENAAFSGLGFDIQAAAVAVHDVLYDGQAEAGSAQLPGSRGIDPVEPLGEARDMLLGDPFALVGYGKGDHRLGRANALQLFAAGDRV